MNPKITLLPFMVLFAALLRATDRRLIGQLRLAGAISPERAVPLRLPPVLGPLRLRRLISGGAIHPTTDGRYSLDEIGLARLTRTRRRIALGLLAILAVAIAVAWWAGIVTF